MRLIWLSLCALLPLAGCTTAPARPDGIARARMGETVYVDGPRVTPLAILEDSRCPAGVQCAWAGRVRISARIDLGARSETRELTLARPQQVADGSLELVEVTPARLDNQGLEAEDYGFGFRFMGGL